MSRATILVVEDELPIYELIRFNLEKEGYRVASESRGDRAVEETLRRKPDLIILDIMLPGTDGIEICKQLRMREETRRLPILMVTARNEDADIILGLELGADDYITKPFSPRVLVARVRALLRRRDADSAGIDPGARLELHGIRIDPQRHLVEVDAAPVTLSLTEYQILEFLARNPGWVFSRSQIITNIKGDDYPVTERSVDVQILNIRKKLGEAGLCIETVRGIGYRMKDLPRP